MHSLHLLHTKFANNYSKARCILHQYTYPRPLSLAKAFNSSVSSGGNVTTSFVRYTPAASHHGHTLTCRGANEELFTSATQIVEDHHALQIYCESRRSNQIRWWSFQQGETENC